MSFKRVGDDPTALRIQKKQRVSDLLLEDIPDDEAKLLKNGRFACVVCKHCPVFDTVAMLSIHRQGKKHLANAKVRLEKLKEDAELRQKREHLKYLETLGTDLSEEQAPLLKITQLKTERALQGSKQLIGCTKNETKPNNVPFFQSRKYITLNLSDVTTGDINRTESNILTNPGRGKPKQSFFQCKQTFNPPVTSMTASVGKSTSKDSSQTRSNSYSNTPSSSESGKLPNGTSDVKKVLSPSEKARREHFSRLRQAGWIMGLDGKWYKDENAEFDSDEDEPPPLPP